MTIVPSNRATLLALMCAAGAQFAAPSPASAISIELKDVAADRIDRQRKAAIGALPLPNTPELANLEGRLAESGLSSGTPVFIRIFKAESELELWMLKDGAYVRFATYPICYWSGTLGPKRREGDRQAPEGFYSMSRKNIHRGRRWPRSLNLGYPNAFDKAQARSGGFILMHGGCNSTGCYAMTNAVMKEVYDLTRAAILGGQPHVPVHVFPFKMTDANFEEYRESPWRDFWLNLKQGYDAFERTKLPPTVTVCEDRYGVVSRAAGESALPGPIEICGANVAALDVLDRWYKAAKLRPSAWRSAGLDRLTSRREALAALRAKREQTIVSGWSEAARELEPPAARAVARRGRSARVARRAGPGCSMARASCRKFVALKNKRVASRGNHKKKIRTASRGR